MTAHASLAPLAAAADLDLITRQVRADIIETSSLSGIPHLGSCLSAVDILSVLYFRVMRHDPTDPQRTDRDRFILSKGHGVPALYQVLSRAGFFPASDMDGYGGRGSRFGEHPPAPGKINGIEAATGSLGHGLPMGLGMALAARMNSQTHRIFVVLGDGECNEGSVWEAAMMAGAQKVGNLVAVVDYNKWQGTGRSNDILALSPLADKWRAFGWDAVEIDGHDLAALETALTTPHDRPLAIVANTVKGRGVSFMEDDNNWHYRIPTKDEVAAAKRELGIGE